MPLNLCHAPHSKDIVKHTDQNACNINQKQCSIKIDNEDGLLIRECNARTSAKSYYSDTCLTEIQIN